MKIDNDYANDLTYDLLKDSITLSTIETDLKIVYFNLGQIQFCIYYKENMRSKISFRSIRYHKNCTWFQLRLTQNTILDDWEVWDFAVLRETFIDFNQEYFDAFIADGKLCSKEKLPYGSRSAWKLAIPVLKKLRIQLP